MSKNTKAWEKQFPIGAKVRLISGGPTMAVKGHHEFSGDIECQWFSGKKLEYRLFAPETLVLVKDDEAEKSS